MAQAIASGMTKPGDKIRTVKGKGGPTSDSVPAKIDGKNVKLSAGEKTIVIPAAVAQNGEAMEQIAAIIASATGVPPQEGIEEGGEYATGSVPEQEPKNIYQGSSIYQGAKNLADGVKGIGSALAAPVTKTADAVQSALTPAEKPATLAEPAKPLTPLTLTLTPTTPYKTPEQKAPGAISQGIGNLWQGAKDLASGLALPATKTLDAIGSYTPNADPRTAPATPAASPAAQPATPSIGTPPSANAAPARSGVGAPATQPVGVKPMWFAPADTQLQPGQSAPNNWHYFASPEAAQKALPEMPPGHVAIVGNQRYTVPGKLGDEYLHANGLRGVERQVGDYLVSGAGSFKTDPRYAVPRYAGSGQGAAAQGGVGTIPADRLAALRAMNPEQAQKQYNDWYGNTGQGSAPSQAIAAPTQAAAKRSGGAIGRVTQKPAVVAQSAQADPYAHVSDVTKVILSRQAAGGYAGGPGRELRVGAPTYDAPGIGKLSMEEYAKAYLERPDFAKQHGVFDRPYASLTDEQKAVRDYMVQRHGLEYHEKFGDLNNPPPVRKIEPPSPPPRQKWGMRPGEDGVVEILRGGTVSYAGPWGGMGDVEATAGPGMVAQFLYDTGRARRPPQADPKANVRTKIAEINAEARKEAERIKAEGQAEAAQIRAGAKNGAQGAGASGYPHFNTPTEAKAAGLPPGTMISTPQGPMRIN